MQSARVADCSLALFCRERDPQLCGCAGRRAGACRSDPRPADPAQAKPARVSRRRENYGAQPAANQARKSSRSA